MVEKAGIYIPKYIINELTFALKKIFNHEKNNLRIPRSFNN